MVDALDNKLVELQRLFAPFVEANPLSEIELVADTAEAPSYQIARPWGDTSLTIKIPPEPEALAQALNGLHLPRRLTALWHREERKLEIIWTARKLQSVWTEVVDRNFSISFEGVEHECHFTAASDALLLIAENASPMTTSLTAFRNLQSFAAFLAQKTDSVPNPGIGNPLCFWISNIDWDENATLRFVRSLNFYMSYFDNRSPLVLVHELDDQPAEVIARTRYLRGPFPSEIKGKPIEQNLEVFWSEASSVTPTVTTPMMSFLLYYRIIEYAALHYIDGAVKSELRKIISAPDLGGDLPRTIEQIVGAVSLKTLDEVPRFKAVIRNNVNPKLVWEDVKANIAAFSSEVAFDGGFSIRPLVGPNESEEGFCTRGLDGFSDTIRKIRNTLSHGKDQETAGMILPTYRNMALLRPWVHTIATAAGEIVIYKDVS